MKEISFGIVPYLIIKNSIYILMGQSDKKQKYGFIKGKIEIGEKITETAIREFEEETYIKLENFYLEDYFYQEHKMKNVGVFLYNLKNHSNYKSLFKKKKLKKFNKENINVELFKLEDINSNLNILGNQKIIFNEIILHFKEKKINYFISNKFFNIKYTK
jgi:ADP-ribose pyrophosphatase YjhB (NUDIX family)